ncbi:MAG: HD domain-containing protein, partial [Spirochaetaceae bacterium]|nr:HD domain-containing protein [Spirochaetaceae bacterium]
MIHKALSLKIFEGFSIERWNDMVRPFDLIEMDKAAEKMVLAYIIGKYEEQNGGEIDWEWLIYGSFFELLRKISLCDIKSPVQQMIRQQFPEEYFRLNEWVISQYAGIIDDEELFNRFAEYIREGARRSIAGEKTLTERVLRAAHKYSTVREFEMIRPVNEPIRLGQIERELNRDISRYLDLRGLQQLVSRQKSYEFILMMERLRFQTRWNQTPRVPKTTVFGHSFFVAVLTLLLSRSCGIGGTSSGGKRLYNNFFCALFHDLPEAVTRDIISPVKQATDRFPSIVKSIEERIVDQELLPLMDECYRDELVYFTSSEFQNRIKERDGQVRAVSFEELNTVYSDPRWFPVDGALVRVADHIAAFL